MPIWQTPASHSRTEQGRLDFHALRHTYISGLSAAGTHPKTAQELARHSDISLTMGVYLHVQLRDLGVAVDSLPAVHRPSAMLATGTEDFTGPILAQKSDVSCDSVRPIETIEDAGNESRESDLPLQIQRFDRDLNKEKESGAAGIRTQNQRIMSPLL